ncbi:type II secretion system protein N [Ramlibacter sp.]|uniref:type II secretion system protein N n=1 Tax=Ramlibacter sp. TaxID=1917967 RepID=UPI002D68FCDA|nr:type II secretion system protein N [Ramlibacter sp.]HYD76812.1 type II secretion system protein N [Ramlibacter sp.]
MARNRLASAPAAPWRWAGGGLLLGLVFALLLFAPAQWLAARVAGATGGQVLLQDARGTIWNGSARMVLTGGPGSSDAAALPSRLQWRLRPAATGAHVVLTTECCTPEPLALDWRFGWNARTLRVADGRSQWPASLLTGLGTPWNTLQLEGQLDLRTESLLLQWAEGRLSVAGQAVLTAERVASRLTTLRPMGSYKLALTGGDVPALRLSTLDGPLRLSGNGQWVASKLRFTGEASAEPEREAALSNLLNIIGRRDGARSIITLG